METEIAGALINVISAVKVFLKDLAVVGGVCVIITIVARSIKHV